MRQLKYHEQKLLKKVNFFRYPKDNTIREQTIIQKYGLQGHDDYKKYNKLVGQIRSVIAKIKELNPQDPFRDKLTEMFLDKLYNMGIIQKKSNLADCDTITVSDFCRRRLPVMLVRLKFAQTVADATKFITGGHIRVGPHVIVDPAFVVTRNMEDFVTWRDDSGMKRHVLKYNEKLDDFDLLYGGGYV